MSVVPGFPPRGPRPRPTGAVVIPFPVPPGWSGRPARPVRAARVPLRLTRRGRAVATVASVFAVAALLAAAVVLLP
ncbi:MAG TPA: hypothetical protein VFX70_07495 [Mycobacteriales bacterium]|nr:hypothetical protein [Mycobacteriales bacterium]